MTAHTTNCFVQQQYTQKQKTRYERVCTLYFKLFRDPIHKITRESHATRQNIPTKNNLVNAILEACRLQRVISTKIFTQIPNSNPTNLGLYFLPVMGSIYARMKSFKKYWADYDRSHVALSRGWGRNDIFLSSPLNPRPLSAK